MTQGLLTMQSLAVNRQLSIQTRYTKSLCAAVSCTAILALHWQQYIATGNNLNFLELVPAVSLLICFLSLPRRPLVYRGNTAVLNESGVSVLNWLLFSWGLHRDEAILADHLTIEDLPKLPFNRSVRAQRKIYDDVSEGESLWKRLARVFIFSLSAQWLLVAIQAVSELSIRFVVQHLLERLERRPGSDVWTWTWIGLLPFSLLASNACTAWASWIGNSRIKLPMIGLIQSLVFEKSMRLRAESDGASTNAKNKSDAPSTMDATYTHR